ncbi:5'-nucleotidase C-terminal domain-containing protein [Paenibacillus caseinilyticus]|uniref:5'-nucleotidase n=1 Tax=Paenibacillus mucilaginosus K02 TaxID=997761 RepID=I0BU07_9BACL|nr:5'-nucleotidase C-terminal domain-containing protein [Paenibacillus mucilaginosus]AFH65854.2 5'-nucleotidase [Paenibacillus mucilaginosus K02]
MRLIPSRSTMIGTLALLMASLPVLPAAAAESGTAPASPSAVTAGAKKSITLLHTNDIHSRVEASDAGIGYAALATLARQYKAENPNTLLLDAGDTFHGQTIANLVRGESIVKLMNTIGYDAMTAGNHDFNYGYPRLVELAGQAKFPVLSSNTKKEDGSRILESYIIKEVDGIKLGIFGLSTPETAFKTHPNNVKGLTFHDPALEAKAIVGELKGKVDAIIALAHLGVDESSTDTSIKVAQAVPEIDVIIDGHSHTEMKEGTQVGPVLIAQTGEYLKNIGRVDLTFENGKLTGKKAGLLTKASVKEGGTAEDPAIVELVKGIKQEQEAVLSQEVGSTQIKLVGDREVVRKGESNLGNLIADAMIAESGADVSLTNGGGIRASIEPGPITKGEVVTVLPFGNYIQTKKVMGSELLAALEHGVSGYPESFAPFPHIGGMTFTFDASKPAGSRVASVNVKGVPLVPEQEYVLATNDFIAAGGDKYDMFRDQPVLGDYASLEEALISYLQKQGAVSTVAAGRINVTGAAPVAVPAPAAGAPASAPAPAAAAEVQPAGGVHVVKPGDSLWRIAKLHRTTWQKLQELNALRNPNLIYPGQQIVLP